MSITSFDHFIETLEHVPAELQRNFQLMEDLDRRSGELVTRISECVREYRKCDHVDDRVNLYKESMDSFDRARSFAEDKIDLAMQTYDLVDKHIRRLEGLSGAQALMPGLNQTKLNTGAENNPKLSKKLSTVGSKHSKLGLKSGKSSMMNSTNSKNKPDNLSEQDDGNCSQGLLYPETLAVDMPLDPNEPKYCTCHQVSFGEMIACDNKDCPIEWFHFACVDLKTKPKGKWYCPECFNINKKGKHKTFKRQRI